MAKPIEPTPILEGKDAERLLSSIDRRVKNPQKSAFLKRSRETYQLLNPSEDQR